jgi:hypothetical protein
MTEFTWSEEQLTYFKALEEAALGGKPQHELLKIQAVAG